MPVNGDVVSCEITPSGMTAIIEIYGWAGATGVGYDLSGFNATLVVVSEGYEDDSLTLVPRLLHLVEPLVPRTPVDSGGNLRVELDIDWPVYDDDRNGGTGTSGYDPTVSVAAGWITATLGGSGVSGTASSVGATNNSELDYPKVIAHWASLPSRRHVWNLTSYGVFTIGAETHSAKNLSFRGNFFQYFERVDSAPIYTGWFHDNFYLHVTGNYIAPGVRAHDGSGYADPGDLDQIVIDPDFYGEDFWMPVEAGPIQAQMSGSDMVVLRDVYGYPNTAGDIGAIVWRDLTP